MPWDTPKPVVVEPAGTPTSFIVCMVMWFIHGFVLDILVIGVLPFISAAASDAQRADKFLWALGGYKGFVSKGAPAVAKIPNLAPTHRRFIAENACYALCRISPIFFITNIPVLLICVISYFIEGVTIAWEINSYGAPAGAMLPQTLMGVFASVTTYTVTMNADGFIPETADSAFETMVMQAVCAMTWACWVAGAAGTAMKKPAAAKK